MCTSDIFKNYRTMIKCEEIRKAQKIRIFTGYVFKKIMLKMAKSIENKGIYRT